MPDDSSPRLTFEEHRELADELRNIRSQVAQFYGLVAGLYGPRNRSGFALMKAVETLERAYEELRSQAEQDCPGIRAQDLYK